MWNIFSRDSSKDFPFEITECPSYGFNDNSLWKLNKGRKKNTVQDVSIFEYLTNDDNVGVATTLAKCAVKHLKTLKHPNIVTFLDSSEGKSIIYLCTEFVEPLHYFLSYQNNLHTDIMKPYISWGIFNVIQGLKFLNLEAKLCHNKVCIWSVFVNKAGQWKIGELEYMNSVDSSSQLNVNELYKVPGDRQSLFSTDVWGLGVLVWEIFNGPLDYQSSLKNIKKIPKEIMKIYSKLIDVNPTNRPSYESIISTLREQKYFGNTLETALITLSQYHLLDDSQRTTFLEELFNKIEIFPENVAQFNVLPTLLEMFKIVKDQKVIFPSVIKLSTMLNDQDFEENIVPCIIKLFESTDRSTRLLLLNQIELYANRLKPDLLNKTIFPLLVNGLADTNPIIRELTVRSVVHISSKLNYNNLNVELMHHFARLQMKDDQDSIRTNITVCLGKIAQYLEPKQRSKILISAFSRALKDPFPPSRMAGVSAFSATQKYYPLFEVSSRVLPALCQVTLDSEKGVRDITFQTIKGYLKKLENASENKNFQESSEEECINITNPSISTWTDWAVTSVTSKFYTPKNSQQNEKSTTELPKDNLHYGQMDNSLKKNDITKNICTERQVNDGTQNSINESESDDWNNSGWNIGDEWEDVDVNPLNFEKDKTISLENQNSVISDDCFDFSTKTEADRCKAELNIKREERKHDRIRKQLESKPSKQQTLKLGGRRLQ